jgi:hypothetical protein
MDKIERIKCGEHGIRNKGDGWKTSNTKQKCKRYTSSGRGMVNLSEIVAHAINEACKMPKDC